MASKLQTQATRLIPLLERRRRLGGFDTNAEDILVICEALLEVIDHLMGMEHDRVKARKR